MSPHHAVYGERGHVTTVLPGQRKSQATSPPLRDIPARAAPKGRTWPHRTRVLAEKPHLNRKIAVSTKSARITRLTVTRSQDKRRAVQGAGRRSGSCFSGE